MKVYPEIEKLKHFLSKGKFSFSKLPSEDPYFFPITFSIDQQSWRVFIDDEYSDYDEKNPLVCLYLVLLALDTYNYAEDYLNWCNGYGLDTSDLTWLDYFKTLEATYNTVEELLGEVDPCISDYDYTLRTGVVDVLLSPDY
jgi:hypothetical protein